MFDSLLHKKKGKHPVFNRKELTLGQRLADKVTHYCGTWHFIITVFIIIGLWIGANVYFLFIRWDPYPFILLNFVLSCIAAMQAPIILMSQNRESYRDRIRSEYDYAVNRKSEHEISALTKEIQSLKRLIYKLKK
ncbi:hypothetical protein CL622_08215 [archaeon]|nr:hypothetical protein [archaeon]